MKKIFFLLSAVAVLSVQTLQAGLVASPGRSAVEVPSVVQFMGRDFWYLLNPLWHELPGVCQEPFIRESGMHYAKWNIREDSSGFPRVLWLREVKVYAESGGGIRAVPCRFEFHPFEQSTRIVHPEHVNDGREETVCAVSGGIEDFRRRYAPVRVRMTVNWDIPQQLQKVIVTFGQRSSQKIGTVSFLIAGKEAVPVKTAVWNGRLTAVFKNLPSVSHFDIICVSAPDRIEIRDFSPETAARLQRYPFESHLMRPVPFGLTPENLDCRRFAELLGKYDRSHLGICFAEWDSQAFLQSWNPGTMFFNEMNAAFGPAPKDRYESLKTLERFWKWHRDIFQGKIWGLSGGMAFTHYPMEWGATMAGLELTNHTSTIPHRTLMRYAAGAARQYGKPWLLYLAYYLGKFSPNSSVPMAPADSRGWAQGPDAGISPSFARRVFLSAYFMGNTFLSFEAQPWGQAEKKADGTCVLNANGRVLREFHEWTHSSAGKRGEWYTPVLLLIDYHHGMVRRGGNVWSWGPHQIPQEKGDLMSEHFCRAIDPYDPDRKSWAVPPYSHNLQNSPLGDIFDTAIGNPPSGRIPDFRRYATVVLTDDIAMNPVLHDRLTRYVVEGGTLVLNSIHRRHFPSRMLPGVPGKQIVTDDDLTFPRVSLRQGEEAVIKTTGGYPLVLKKKFGMGNVILSLPDFFIGSSLEQPSPYIQRLLLLIQKEVLPFRLEGDAQFLVSRLGETHWKLALINNKGIIKMPWDRQEKQDPSFASEVHVLLPEGGTVQEIYAGAEVADGRLVIPPGGVRVLEIKSAGISSEHSSSLLGHWKLDGTPGRNFMGVMKERTFDMKYAEIGKGRKVYEVSMPRTAVQVNLNPGFPLLAGTFELWAAPDFNYRLSDRGGYPLAARFFRIYMNNRSWGFNILDKYSMPGPPAEHGRWDHLAVTWNSSECRFFVNGKEYTCDGVPLKLFLPIWNREFQIGTLGRGRRTFGGRISDVRLYIGELTPAQIRKHYESSKSNYRR